MDLPDEDWVRIELSWACFAVKICYGIVSESAPIASWSVGKPALEVLQHFKSRGAKLQRICQSKGYGEKQ